MSASGRRAIVRWAWRLFKRDWRQQILVLGLLTFAVAAVLYSTVAVSNAMPRKEGEFGRAQAIVSFRVESARQVSRDIAALGDHIGVTEAVGHRSVAVDGAVERLDFRAQRPGGKLGAPMLALRAGRYPTKPTEIALTDGAVDLVRAQLGGSVTFDGAARVVVGVVQNPAKFDDEFALAASSGFEPEFIRVLTEHDFDPGGMSRVAGNIRAFSVQGRGENDTAAAAALVLLVSAVLMLLIALVTAAGFAAVAHRRLRQLGMVSAIGATDKQARLVMVVNGTLVGAVAAAGGMVVAGAVWATSKAALAGAVGHEIAGLGVQWWVVAIAVGLTMVTATAAAWWPARTAARIPVVEALSGRPPRHSAAHRPVGPALVLLTGGVVAAGAGVDITSGDANPFLLLGGALAVVLGVLLFAPLAIRGVAAAAGRAPIAVRLALRDLSRYQARSGAALAAISLGLGISVATVVIAAAAADGATEGNLAANQMVVRTRGDTIPREQFSATRLAVRRFTAGTNGTKSYALEAAITRLPMVGPNGGEEHPPLSLVRKVGARSWRWVASLYIATPELLARAGLRNDGAVDGFTVHTGELEVQPVGRRQSIPRIAHYDAPAYGSAPTALITPDALTRYGFERQPVGWFLEADHAFTSREVALARDIAASAQLSVEVRDAQSGLLATRAIATAVGAFVALCLLALTIGLIRSEAGRDVQTLVAAGATSFTRRALTAATSGVLALLGSTLAIGGAYIALVAIYLDRPSDLSAIPVVELSTLLFGLPLVATAAGWLVSGREPAVIARHVLD